MNKYRVRPGQKVDLVQEVLFAERRRKPLIVLQGLETLEKLDVKYPEVDLTGVGIQ